MEPLFRFMLFRPPVERADEDPSIDLAQKSTFQIRLAEALGTEDPRGAAVRTAQNHVDSADFISAPEEGPLAAETVALRNRFSDLAAAQTVTRTKILDAIKSAFGMAAAEVASSDDFTARLARLKDSILAIKYVPAAHRCPIHALTQQLRDLSIVEAAVSDTGFPGATERFRRMLGRSIRLPEHAGLAARISSAERDRERKARAQEARKARTKQVTELVERYRRLVAAETELSRVDASDLAATPVRPHAGVTVPAELLPEAAVKAQFSFGSKLSSLLLERVGQGEEPRSRDGVPALSRYRGVGELAGAAMSSTPRLIAGTPAFEPPDAAGTGFHLRAERALELSGQTRETLSELGLDPRKIPLDRIVEHVRDDYMALTLALEALLDDQERRTIRFLGDTVIAVATPATNVLTNLLWQPLVSVIPDLAPLESGFPLSHRKIEPSGVSDLLIVKQQLVGYEPADIAHIENILKGETKSREHVRRQRTEEFTLLETEITSTEERELATTDRFELSRETNKTIASDSSLKAGLTVSGKYGPTVEFSASAEGSTSRSREETTRTASEFSQDVTERSAQKVSERVLERATLRVTNEITDTNSHGFDNVGGTEHVVGIYQWVNKVYEAQVYNYGLRMIFDFMVPEPGAMLAEVMSSAHAHATELQKPPAFTLKPNQVSEATYGFWVRAYGATDVEPPPDIFTTISHDYSGGNGDEKTDYNHSTQLSIPDGYRAIQGCVAVGVNVWDKDKFSVDLVLGRRAKRMSDADLHWVTTLSEERNSIPFALNTLRVSDIALALEVKCQRTTNAMKKWRADTHAKLTTAYRVRLAEYEEKLAALEFDAGAKVEGLAPALNLKIMQDELKKHCISLMTDQHFELFDAIDTGSFGLLQLDLDEAIAEGPYVRFFEQAFEWENLTWVTYPYYWGRRSGWRDKVVFKDVDPLFSDFVKAGYARVSIPVRSGFESAIEHFMTFGEIWNGGPLPVISDPLFLPIAEELAERMDRPGEEIPQGEPWTVRIPTTLVRLREDGSLPKWEKDASGDWVPV